ncbi:hypothetical protein M5U04_13375 [Xenorhabdus sp. XENO-1]|uniref:hypothetical protein n=1 Tax=Xenorhabdus bovienii TaxID=40576 RepID=UPI0020CA3741|nr:hypothetical protein [Xenorhabdus bovienii]MCP9269055.1 hypothetical protein [Xenorhabdus bovienii subsp. africana]
MKFFIFPLVLSAISSCAIADGKSLDSICQELKGTTIYKKVKITDINTARGGNVNYKISENNSKWYYFKGNSDAITHTLYDFLKLSFVTGEPMDVCITKEGDTLALQISKVGIKK